MARMTFRQPAPADSLFDDGAFAGQIGKTVPLAIAGCPAGSVQLVEAKVIFGGQWAELTIEPVTDEARERFAALGAS